MIVTTIIYACLCLLLLLLIAILGILYYGWQRSARVPPAVPGTTKIACVGDSITYGALIRNRKERCYPAQLEKLLGNQYSVRNFGVNGHTLQKSANRPYWEHKHFKASSEFGAEIVLIMLGTNDSTEHNWKGIDTYITDYRKLIDHYRSLQCHPVVFAITPPTEFSLGKRAKTARIRSNERISTMTASIKKLAEELSIGVIDINAATKNHPECFQFDGVHPNAQGAKVIAEAVYAKLTSK
jgi:acyl-CoA thioesterase-1